MKIDEDLFRSILFETIDENPLASRAVLSLCAVEFTTSVSTLSVSLGKKSTLFVNLEFVRTHCETVEHVKTLLIHEFLHILLGHTLRIKEMTPAINIALDAVINAIIHRKFGISYSSLMSRYYGAESGLIALLRPLNSNESNKLWNARNHAATLPPLLEIHEGLYAGSTLAEDVLSVANSFSKRALNKALASGLVLLGGHEREPQDLEALGQANLERFKQGVATIGGGIFHDPIACKPSALAIAPKQKSVPLHWRQSTLPVLKRLLQPDPKSFPELKNDRTCFAPILNTADRRGSLRAIWSPLIPEIAWESTRKHPIGSVQIYLDVSGSMDPFLEALVTLLAVFSKHIRKPLWAFSTKVCPARIIQGRLDTQTTGGTSLACVFEHIRKTAPRKALIVTDGFVEYCPQRPACEVEAIIPHDGSIDVLKRTGLLVTRLPILGGKLSTRN